MAEGNAMTSDLDIYRSANLLVQQHGEDAPIHAAMRADAMLGSRPASATAITRPSCAPAPIAAPQKPTAPCQRQEGRKPKTSRFLAPASPLGGILPLG